MEWGGGGDIVEGMLRWGVGDPERLDEDEKVLLSTGGSCAVEDC